MWPLAAGQALHQSLLPEYIICPLHLASIAEGFQLLQGAESIEISHVCHECAMNTMKQAEPGYDTHHSFHQRALR